MSTYSDTDSITSDSERLPPMKLCARPPQFPDGKTATSLDAMEKMILWFLDSTREFDLTHRDTAYFSKFKRIVHLIFVNNSLIEGDQWKNRMIKRGIQNMTIFSSKSDVNDTATLHRLITEGEYDSLTDIYTPIDYVLMCTHPIRLQNICEEDNGDSILKRIERHNPHIGFVPWFDEMDKFLKLHTDFIPKFQKFSNVIQLNAITATPYSKFWKIMHECGYTDIDLIGELPDPRNYRTMQHHSLCYNDILKTKSPVDNFLEILMNPGKVSYRVKAITPDTDDTIHVLPDLSLNKPGRIMFVPGESACKTHHAIKDIATAYKKNTLMINGKTKGFYTHDKDFLCIKKYKEKKIAQKVLYQGSSYSDLGAMDVAVIMYNDPELDLKSRDLVITGFHCVERGVTFNRPNFQFTVGIFTPYHYTEASDLVESIIQICGRCFGNKEWVPEKIIIISPKYIVDTVEKAISDMIEFLRTKPTSIQYADVYRERNGIPIMINFVDETVLNKIIEIKKLKSSDKVYIQNILKEAHDTGKIILTDTNHADPRRHSFSFDNYIIEGKRVLEEGNDKKNYRFDKFYDNFLKKKCYGQTVKGKGCYSLDITMVDYPISDELILTKGTGFISFVYKAKPQVDTLSQVDSQ